ncbi:NAD(P)-dependent oxidoreductase [Paraglaciecola psychrophila]|jgi:3-hydroxyisobutyrate dehydrogenase-like beta-hydroxyacid dehydrogenase|uniref:3-hydroxyisobutyrate dehydrogenase n=1 Tax=Paraglaciecola psychrophila 170 TaxID=1129794 RepID=K7A661_9ALTE|nr:NAD(P)-dependent oxidoreductase [Paraglaciecola psychrophila]AGH44935.1 3-hydroxyisobutyrate dehydrogenase [Paraglaciecola psychrophila 170]GAC36288.1 3-hydroxyisobutyrate dehydrogenase [Paraglaciecola psychrophila 170]
MKESKLVQKIAFVGLGVMGYPMAGHCKKSGFEVTVYNRTTEKSQTWVDEFSGQMALTPKLAAEQANVILLCVGNDDDLRSVMLGDHGVLAGINAGDIIVDHTTASAEVAREMATLCAELGVGFLDAPVSGGQAGAENGQLTVMVGGQKDHYTAVEPVIDCYAKFSQLLGEVGSGQLAKMMNQICIAGVVQGIAEALSFGKNAGLDCHAVIDVISKGAAQSWQMENRFESMLAGKFDFGFAVDWMRKDLGIALNEAKRNGSSLPLTALVDQFYADVQKKGGGRWDTSSLLTRLQD